MHSIRVCNITWIYANLIFCPQKAFIYSGQKCVCNTTACLSCLSFLFAAVIDLLLGLLAVKKLVRKRHQDRQILAWSSQVCWQEILLWVFHSTFWAFLCVSKAPFGRSLWSGHHWKDLFLLQKLSIDDADFGQKWWRQKWKKGQGLSWAVTAA